ncbi:hypothetical protein [Camelimonas lactis]|nr:hypothetical protein [Camelimonas lactis]
MLSEPGEADGAVFAVWSQQWPRLRRNFRFQTAVTRGKRTSFITRFDISFHLRGGDEVNSNALGESAWLSLAISDAKHGPEGALRTFLHRYGVDVRRQRGSFRPLAEIKLLDVVSDQRSGRRLLELITATFPDPEDAASLKQDIVDGVLVPVAQIEVLSFVLSQGQNPILPLPTIAGLSRLEALWPIRSDDMLDLAERAVGFGSALGSAIFTIVSGIIPPDEFWALTTKFPSIRLRMVTGQPELLLLDGMRVVDNATVASMLKLVPTDAAICNELITRLLDRDNEALARAALDHFPRSVAAQVIAALDEGALPIGSAWVRVLAGQPEVLLDPTAMSRVSKTSLFYELAETLGWLTPEVIRAGILPWMAAISDIANDLNEDRSAVLQSFLVALALMSGSDSGRRVLEEFFHEVHERIMGSSLPLRARDMLLPMLPDAGWYKNWDLGARLRLAIATAYVEYNYPPKSYAMLGRTRKSRLLLADAAGSVRGGEALEAAARRG